jgi:hypothetical protein
MVFKSRGISFKDYKAWFSAMGKGHNILWWALCVQNSRFLAKI